MTPYQILWNLPIVVTSLSLWLLIVAVLIRKELLVFVAATLIMANANVTPVVAITADLGWGLGSACFLMGSVMLVLLLYYRLNPVRLLFPRAGWPGVLLFLTLCYILLISPILSIDRVDTIRRSLSYLLVYTLGWVIFGLIFAQHPERTRTRVYIILYTAGLWTIMMMVATLILIGPSAFSNIGANMRSVIELGSYRGQRLEMGFLKATGISMGAATSIFLIIHWWHKWGRSILRRITLAIILAVLIVVFLWSAGRTAMLGFAGTVILLLLLVIIVRRGKRRFKAVLVLLMLGLALIPLTEILADLFLRAGESSLLDAFWNSRLSLAMEGIAKYKSNLVWGTGTGVLLSSFTVGDIAVESFFIRILIELGAIGGTIYLIAWLMLTYYVVKVDLHYMRQKHSAAWLPSSGFIFIWMTSPAGFGFSLFGGNLALHLAIAAAAFVEWKRIQIKKATKRDSA